jgi:hypothetical protein
MSCHSAPMNNLSKWLGSALVFSLLITGGGVLYEVAAEMSDYAPQYSEVKIERPGAMRLANRVKLAQVDDITMLQYYEKKTGKQALYFTDGTSSSHVILSKFGGIQSDRSDFRGSRFDQVEHFLPSLQEVWIFSEAPTKKMDVRLGFMSPVMISHYALSGSPLPTSAALLSSKTFGDDHSRTGAFTSLKSGGMIASWYQSYVVNPHEDRREEIGIVYRDPQGQWSTLFPIAIDGSAGGGIPQSRQAIVQHPADDGIWLFNKRDSYHSMEVVHLSETDSGIVVDWIDPLFINEREHGTESLEAEFPAIVAIPDPIRKVIILAFGDNGYYMTNCEGNCFQKVTPVTVMTITANGTQRFETYSPFTIERTTRFGMALAGTKLWFVYKPLQLFSEHPPALEAISYDMATGFWSPSASLGEPFRASRELSAVFGTDPLVFAHLMVDQKIHYFSIEDD